MKINKITLIGFILINVCFYSCQKEELIGTNIKDHFFLRNNGADMPVYVEGNTSSGIFLLWLHGGPGGTALVENFGPNDDNYTVELENKYAMVYWDQRCSGNSQGTFDYKDLSLDIYVEDLEKLITLLQYRYGNDIKIFIVSHSWGGTLGSAYLSKGENQINIRGWLNIAGAHNIPLVINTSQQMILTKAEEQIDFENFAFLWQEIVSKVRGLQINNSESFSYLFENAIESIRLMGAIDSINNIPIPDLPGLFNVSPLDYQAIATNIGNTMNSGFINDFIKINLSENLNKITIPTIFLWGKFDFIVPLVVADDAFMKIGSTEKEIIIYQRSAHWPYDSEKDLFVNDVLTFVNRYK